MHISCFQVFDSMELCDMFQREDILGIRAGDRERKVDVANEVWRSDESLEMGDGEPLVGRYCSEELVRRDVVQMNQAFRGPS